MSYCDRRLLGRIKQYISEHQHHRISSDIMAEELQMTYFRDYGRRKRNAFRKLVREAHALLQDSKLVNQIPKDLKDKPLAKRRKPMNDKDRDTGSDSDPEGFLVEYSDTNTLNSSMMSMYKKKQRTSSSAPASPFSYVDSPMVAVGQTTVNPSIQENEQNDNSSMKLNHEDTSVANSEAPSATKSSADDNLASNVAVSEDFIATPNLIPKTPQRKAAKKRKSRTNQVQPEDFEITGEKAKPKFNMETPNVKFRDVGGNEKTLKEVCNLLLHVKRPEIYKALGVVPPCGVLLHGPPGCGKSLLANAIAGELDVPMLKLAATEIVSGVSGESEEKLRDMFEIAVSSSPCVIFIDEIDAITPKRELASKDMERRIVAQLLACLDDLSKTPSQILVIGATNRPDSIDPALRRAGRFDKEISMGIPDEKARADILKVLCKGMKLESDFNFSLLARLTPGYVGADLMSLCQEAATSAVNRIIGSAGMRDCAEAEMNTENEEDKREVSETPFEVARSNRTCDLSSSEFMDWLRRACPLTDSQLESLCIEFSDFENAVATVQPSAKREGFATVPDVTWEDIGALENIREELTIAVLAPVRNPEAFSALGLTKPPGILLAGPPGCGKTLLAKAIASESGINFISVKGPELLNMYVGESERAVRQCFERARNSSPCVVFFDELDSLCPRRSGAESASTSRVVNQMLTEMDGLQTRGNVFVIAATNRPDIIDPAVLRPGRLDKTLYVGLPDADDRAKILRTLTKNGTKPPISDKVSLGAIATDDRCSRFTGADLSSLVREAAVNALREHISIDHVTGRDARVKAGINVTAEHFEKAWAKVKPSVSLKDQLHYEKMRINLEMT